PGRTPGDDVGHGQPGRDQAQDEKADLLERSYEILTAVLCIREHDAIQILVVEDDARLAATLERVLAAEGPGVMLAGDGIDALLRRTTPADHLRFADLVLEPASRGAWRGERALALTQTEFALLEHFLRHPRQVLTREQLLDAVWDGEPESDNVVAVYIGYVRQK